MRAAVLLLPALLAVRADASAEAAALVARALPQGFAPAPSDPLGPISIPIPVPVPLQPRQAFPDTDSVALGPLLDRHWWNADSFYDQGARTRVSGTLDFDGNGYLTVIPPGASVPYFFKIQRGMAGSWSWGNRVYKVGISVNFFRPRLENILQIRDARDNRLIWERRISELYRLAYRAGELVTLAGRTYSLFFSHCPDNTQNPPALSAALGLALVHEQLKSNGELEYKFYLLPIDELVKPAPYRLFGGDLLFFSVSADLALLSISR